MSELTQALALLHVEHQLLTAEAAHHLIDLAESSNDDTPVVEALLDEVSRVDVLTAIADALDVPFVDLNGRDTMLSVAEDMLAAAGTSYLSEHALIPMTHVDGTRVAVTANPEDRDALAYLRSRAGDFNEIMMADRQQINAAILVAASMATAEITPGPNAVPNWIDALLVQALAQRASDIHFRYSADGTLLTRVRIDGVLRKVAVPDAIVGKESEVVAAVLARCETLDGANLREPQDGSFQHSAAGGKKVEVRVALLPQTTGPNVTLRLLDADSVRRTPEEMGMDAAHIEALRNVIAQPSGALIVTGPTGSGKSTTLFSLLAEVDSVARNALSIEQPVEYSLPGLGQTAIREDLGARSLTWARALRSILRSDPDVILVGEIRDPDVAKTALEASATGHLILTTLHANSAPAAFVRLGQMGLKPHEVADAVTAVVSQRLIRTLCDCATIDKPTVEEADIFTAFNMEVPEGLRRATGCTACAGTGFSGRRVVMELLIPDGAFRDVIARPNPSAADVDAAAIAAGWRPLSYDALRIVAEGASTMAEARRITGLTPVEHQPAEDIGQLPTLTFGFGEG